MGEEIRDKILEFLKENKKEDFSVSKLKEKVGFSYPTVLKWVVALQSENLIIVRDFGNIKLISFKENEHS